MSAKNRAAALLSFAGTMVWLSTIAIDPLLLVVMCERQFPARAIWRERAGCPHVIWVLIASCSEKTAIWPEGSGQTLKCCRTGGWEKTLVARRKTVIFVGWLVLSPIND